MDDVSVGNLGSLAESARSKQLKTARSLLIFIGAITLIANAVVAVAAESIVDKQIENEIAAVRAQGIEVDESAVEEVRATAVRAVQVSSAIFALLGVLYIVFGVLVYRAPVPITIAGLVLYIGSAAVVAYLDPGQLKQFWWFKILIVVALFKAVQAAIASEQEKTAAAGLDSLPSGV